MTNQTPNSRSRAPQALFTVAPSSNAPNRRKQLRILLLVLLFLTGGIIGGGSFFVWRMYETLPTVDQLQNINPPLVSRVLGVDGSVIHEFSIERRFWMPLDKVPQDLINAVVAIEDRRFYSHWGVDVKRIFGAMAANLLRGQVAQGASTLTQQLARNVYLSSRQTLTRKIREALTAVQLESYYSKNEIMEFYLNQVYLGAGVYGVEAASQRYFSKSVSDLTLNECAVLAGTIQLPERYRPDKAENLQRITDRRNTVLRAMRRTGYIEKSVALATINDTIPNNPPKQTAALAPYFIEMVRRQVAAKYGDDELYNGGLTIHTTLDPVAQDSAEQAVKRHLATIQQGCNALFLDKSRAHRQIGITRERYLESFDSIYARHASEYKTLPDSVKLRIAQVSVIALDVKSGAIRALIGGRDFDESKFNRAIQARRQPGSAIKPLVYTAAIDTGGFTPASIILDQPITLMTPAGEWRPENYDREFYGPMMLRDALAKSVNMVAIQVLNQVGAETVINYARRMGLKQSMSPVPALAIGACEATPMEMTSAYAIFANRGIKTEPYAITRIYDSNNRLLEEFEPVHKQVLSAKTAFIMADMLTDVVRRGTAASIPGLGFSRPAGGKTGTTNDYSDAWFIGFTPQMACGVWVGIDERRSMGYGMTGTRAAIPIWVPTMQALHRSLEEAWFSPPEGVALTRICQSSHKLANQYCPAFSTQFLVSGSMSDSCDVHLLHPTRSRESHDMFDSPEPRREQDKSRSRGLMF